MRTFHIGGVGQHDVEESDIKAKRGGIVKYTRLKVVTNDAGQKIVLTRNGEVSLVDEKGREVEKYEVPAGAILKVNENDTVAAGGVLCEWDPHSIPILAETGGKVRFEDLIDGQTMRSEKDPSGHIRYVIMEHKGDMHPQVVVEDPSRRQDSRLLLHARAGSLGSRRRPDHLARYPGRQDAPRGERHAGHHGRSAARDGNLRSPQAEGPGRHRRDRRHGRAAFAKRSAASGRSSSAARAASSAST